MPQPKAKAKGIYLVSETGCLREGSGANKHITAGLFQLQKYFDIELLLFCEGYRSGTDEKKKDNNKRYDKPPSNISTIPVKEAVKWFYLFIKNHIHFFKYYKSVKKISPDFIYERSSYLNFNGLIIAKLLGISHIYEVNGVLSKDNAKYFPGILNRISLWLEKASCRNTFGFYVGGINEILEVPQYRAHVIQNGIEEAFAKQFKDKISEATGQINITFIGHAMHHHRLDVLIDALKLVDKPSQIHLHLIGSNLESVKENVPELISTTYYGSLNQDEISALIKGFHIGIITYALPYFSHVKVFMYGAAKLAIMLPSVKNFRKIFEDDEVIFINNGDPADIAKKLDYFIENPALLQFYGENVYKKICQEYTWEEIYAEVADKITNLMKQKTPDEASPSA